MKESPRLEPVDSSSVNRDGLFSTDVGTVLQVTVLTFLLSLEVKTSETTQVLLHHGFINGGTTTNTFTVVMGNTIPG